MESVKASLSVACGAVYLAADSRGQRHSKKGAALCAVRTSHAEERRLIPSFFLRDGRYEAAMFVSEKSPVLRVRQGTGASHKCKGGATNIGGQSRRSALARV